MRLIIACLSLLALASCSTAQSPIACADKTQTLDIETASTGGVSIDCVSPVL